MGPQDLRVGAAFIGAAGTYWLVVFPVVRAQLRRWRRRAAEIPDPGLRADALGALQHKRGNVEGAAAFAVLAPLRSRTRLARFLAAYQIMHDYLDTISERESSDPLTRSRDLHQALDVALDTSAVHLDYFARQSVDDSGYLRAQVEACWSGASHLPSMGVVEDAARHLARLSGEAQSRIHAHQNHEQIERWAAGLGPASWLTGWEIAAAACSTLAIYALLALAASPSVDRDDVPQTVDCYFPWVNALSTLLDRVVDEEEDASAGVRLAPPPSRRVTVIAGECARRCSALPNAERHVVVAAGMCAYYVTAANPTTHRDLHDVLRPFGLAGFVAQAVFGARGQIGRPRLA